MRVRFAQAKSKNDKNISGLLNQIIDNKEAGKIGIHTFTNASSFNVSESDVKIISIEFAASEEVMAQFFGSVILSVKADQIEKSVTAKTDVIIPAVEVTGVETENDGSDELPDGTDLEDDNAADEPEVIGNTKEQTVSVELPVAWKEDGQALVHFTFEFNDFIIEIHQPEPVDEINHGTMLTTDYPTDILEMHRRISDGMILGKLPFVYETAIYENPLRLEVAVGDIEESQMEQFLDEYDPDRKYVVIFRAFIRE